MKIVRISWQGDPFENMTEEEKEIFNLGLNLMAMPIDHPQYKADSERLDQLLSSQEKHAI